MLKKVLVGAFVLVMVGAMVTGIVQLVNPTEHTQVEHERKGDGRQAVAETLREEPLGRGQVPEQGQGSGRGQPPGANPRVIAADWEMLEGVVVETTDELVIKTDSDRTVQVGLGPSEYRESQEFALQVGERVRVAGYLEDGEFKAGQVQNLDTGVSIVLRDESGRPMWAGQGRRSGTRSV